MKDDVVKMAFQTYEKLLVRENKAVGRYGSSALTILDPEIFLQILRLYKELDRLADKEE